MSIKEIREGVGMSRKDFCERFKVSKSLLYEWESGKRKCPPYSEKLIMRFITAEKCTVFLNGLSFNRILDISGLSMADFSRRYEIPYKTAEQWKKKAPKEYTLLLLERAVKEDKLSGLL